MAATSKPEAEAEMYVYRICPVEEWKDLQRTGASFGADLDKSNGFYHLCKLSQVESTLQRFFTNVKEQLYLLEIDAKMLGDGLIYEAAEGGEAFPHYYGPYKSHTPLPLEFVVNAERINFVDGKFKCRMFA